ncbi:MAG: class I SAM-dependent methyltransferase [Ilumatobacteraceae bacterium]
MPDLEAESKESQLSRAEATWDSMDVEVVRSVAFLALDCVSNDIWEHFSPGTGPIEFANRMLSNRRAGATSLIGAALVCGDMQSERSFFENMPYLPFSRVDGFDLSQASLDRYTPDGIDWHPHKADCNELELPDEAFDFVVASHGAHHIMNLENFFEQARRSMRPGGLFYMYEWIGPLGLQIPRRNRVFATLLLYTLFPRPSTRTTHMGRRKGLRYIQDPVDSFDPSEACNSLRLHPEYRRNFDSIAEYRHAGLSYPMFEGLAQNMDVSRRSVRMRLALTIKIERLLTRMKLVHPLFVVALGEPSKASGGSRSKARSSR